MRSTLIEISRYSAWLPFIVVAISAVLTNIKTLNKRAYPLIVLVVFYLAIEMSSGLLIRLLGGQNIAILPYYLVIEVWLISVYFQRIGIDKHSQLRKWLFMGIVLVEAFFINNDWMTISRIIEAALILLMCGSWFRTTYNMKERHITRLPEFWAVSGMLLFFIPSALILLFEQSVIELPYEFMSRLRIGRDVMNVVNKLTLTISLWMYFRQR